MLHEFDEIPWFGLGFLQNQDHQGYQRRCSLPEGSYLSLTLLDDCGGISASFYSCCLPFYFRIPERLWLLAFCH